MKNRDDGHKAVGCRGSTARHTVPRAREVALLLETSRGYGRGLLRGILLYARLHGPWSLEVGPGHLDQAWPAGATWKGNGVIARVGSLEAKRRVRSLGLPCVVSSVAESRAPLALAKVGEIRSDSEAIAKMAAAHLLEAGFRRFAFCGFIGCHWSMVREEAFSRFVNNRGFVCSAHRISLAHWMARSKWMKSWQQEQPPLIRWLKSMSKPAGLMACNDDCGREVLQACATAGMKVPDEVAVVGVDNDEMVCELASPPLSSVALDLEKAGYQAASLLDGLMKGRRAGGEVWVRPTHVVSRRSSDAIMQEDPVVARAMQFIRDRTSRNLGVNEVCEEVGVSRRTLERRFLLTINQTVHDEIMRRRLERAKQLLVETELPCHTVAVEAGFGSLNTFNRTFGRSQGMTPQDFRRQARPLIIRRAATGPATRGVG